MKHILLMTILLPVILFTMVPVASAQVSIQNPSTVYNTANKGDFRLLIPTLNIDLPVVTAPVSGNSWDFTRITQQAGHLEGLPLPGEGNNVVIGAHSEFSQRRPGPFYHLNDLHVGDQIIVSYQGNTFTYQVEAMWEVVPTRIDPILSTAKEALTLMTCSGYKNGKYSTRLIVRASLID